MIEKLFCQVGNHEWERERAKGRKPISCPDHRTAILVTDLPSTSTPVHVDTATVTMETLHCAEGHDWTRLPVRGKKPKWCPEHRPVKVAVSVKPQGGHVSENETLWCEPGQHEWIRPRQRGKRPSACPDHKVASSSRPQITPLATLCQQYDIDPESMRILQYVEDQINNPHRVEPVTALMEGYNIRLRQVMRSQRAA